MVTARHECSRLLAWDWSPSLVQTRSLTELIDVSGRLGRVGKVKNGEAAGQLSTDVLSTLRGCETKVREARRRPLHDNQTHQIPVWTWRKDESERHDRIRRMNGSCV